MKKADQFAVKNFVSKQEERARPAYGRFEEIQPRVCVFIGTFNTAPSGELIEYLNAGDQRRWWPVLVGDIDIEGLERDRDQLFAEAMYEYQVLGTPLYLPPSLETEARAIAATREQPDMLAEKLSGIASTVLAAHRRKGSDAFDSLRVQPTARGDKLFKCGEAEPFAMVLKPTETEEGLCVGLDEIRCRVLATEPPERRQGHCGGDAQARMGQGRGSTVGRRRRIAVGSCGSLRARLTRQPDNGSVGRLATAFGWACPPSGWFATADSSEPSHRRRRRS